MPGGGFDYPSFDLGPGQPTRIGPREVVKNPAGKRRAVEPIDFGVTRLRPRSPTGNDREAGKHIRRPSAVVDEQASTAVREPPAGGSIDDDCARERMVKYRHPVSAHDDLVGICRRGVDAVAEPTKSTVGGGRRQRRISPFRGKDDVRPSDHHARQGGSYHAVCMHYLTMAVPKAQALPLLLTIAQVRAFVLVHTASQAWP